MAPSVSGSSHSPSPRNAQTRLLGRVVEMAVQQVAIEAGVVQRADRAEAHADRRELPEVGHQPWVRVAAQAGAVAADLAAELIEVGFVQPSFEERACVDARCGVTLEVDVVAGVAVVLAAEEVVEADLVQAGRAGVGAEVAADSFGVLVRAHDHHRCVPTHERADAALDVLVAGEPRLGFARDGVDVRRADRRGEADLRRVRPFEQLAEQETRPMSCRAISMTAFRLSIHSSVSPGSLSGSWLT